MSDNKKSEAVLCSKCNFEIAAVHEDPVGGQTLTVNSGGQQSVALKIDNRTKEATITCPKCNHVMPTDISFWSRF